MRPEQVAAVEEERRGLDRAQEERMARYLTAYRERFGRRPRRITEYDPVGTAVDRRAPIGHTGAMPR